MNHIAQAASTPHNRPPRQSIVVLVMHALLFALVMSPGHVAHAVESVEVRSSSADRWAPPISGATETDVLNPFIPPEMPWSSAHRGIDFRATAEQIVSPAAGEVTFVGTVVDRPVLTIRHPNGLLSSFEPVESDLQIGSTVARGDVIGTISSEARHCDVSCVHWGVRQPDAWHIGSTVRDLYIDPAILLGWAEPSILWPLRSDPAP